MKRAMKRALLALRLAVYALPALAASWACACPGDVPAGLTATAVGRNIVVDGLTLSVLLVRGRAPANAVLAQAEAAWRAAGYDVRRTQAPGWRIVAARSAACLSTLQLTDHGDAFGYLAVSPSDPSTQPGRGDRTGATRLPVPPGATVLTSVSSSDDGRQGTIAALTSARSLESLHGDFLQRLRAERWDGVSSQVSLDRARTPVGALVSARRGRARIEVVLWRDGVTHAVINLADAL